VTAALDWSECNLISAWILAWLGRALLHGTILTGLTWLIAQVLHKRVPAALHVALWSLVLLKFLAPIGPAWSHSLASLATGLARVSLDEFPQSETADPGGEDDTGATAGPQPDFVVLPAASQGSVHRPASGEPLDWRVLLVAAYLVSVLGLLVARARTYLAFRSHCRTFPIADVATRSLVARVCRRLGVRRVPETLISDEPPAPFVMGLFRPVLVLTRRQLVRPDELETVIVHEVAHFRRGDVCVRVLQRVAGTFLFFWPVVAWVNRRISEAREQACDQWALRHGKLTAGEYARCLLNTTRPTRALRMAGHPVCLAANAKTIERRIDVILDSASCSTNRRVLGLPAVFLLVVWSGFVLGGSDAAEPPNSPYRVWPATADAVKEHATEIYNMVAARKTADLNGDGVLSYCEKSAYLVALAMQAPETFTEEFPYADRDHSGRLDYLEAYGVIRGITLVAYADRRPGAAVGATLDLEFYHVALDAQQWLLDNVKTEPSAAALENIKAVVVAIQSPKEDHSRKLDHGCREACPQKHGRASPGLSRFQELEANIAAVKAKLAVERDAERVARLQIMLDKLEAILAKLKAA